MQTKEELEVVLAEAAPMLEEQKVRYLSLDREDEASWRLSFSVSTSAGPSSFNGQWGLSKERVWTAKMVFEDIMDIAQRCRS